MAKKIPQKISFDIAEKLNFWQSVSMYTTAFISFGTGIIDLLAKSESLRKVADICLPGLILFVTVGALILRLVFTSVYRRAESIRRDAFIDNAFGCLMADSESEEYFSNDQTPIGIKKALLNIEENCFFSIPTIDHMFKAKLLISIPAGVALLIVMIYNLGGSQFVMLAFNLILSLSLFDDVVRLYDLKQGLYKIHENCKSILAALHENEYIDSYNHYSGKIIREIVRYETTLSYASTMLNSKYFQQINKRKSNEWRDFKKRYEV